MESLLSTDYVLYLMLPPGHVRTHLQPSSPTIYYASTMHASFYQYTYSCILHAIPVHFTSPYSSTLEANHLEAVRSSLQGLPLDCCLPTPRASTRSTELHLMC